MIWRYTGKVPDRTPDNVKMMKWVPQNDLLGSYTASKTAGKDEASKFRRLKYLFPSFISHQLILELELSSLMPAHTGCMKVCVTLFPW